MKITIERTGIPTVKLNVDMVLPANGKTAKAKPVAFILPGGPGADLGQYQQYATLKDVSEVVFHDPRGCGQSERGDLAACTMDNYIDDVDAIRTHLGLEKIVLIGKSYGSMCALGYALRYPHAVEKLVLSAGAPSYRFLAKAKKNLQRIGTPEQIKVAKKLWAGNFANREELLYYFCLTNSLYSVKAQTQPDSFDLAQKVQRFAYDVLNEGFKQEFWHFDYENDLRRVLCPTLILAGQKDWITDVELAEFMATRIPYSQLQIFEQASHAMEADVPDAYFKALRDFIR